MAGAPGILVYPCKDGIHRSLYPDRRDCPENLTPEKLDIGSANGNGSRFFGRIGGDMISEEEAAMAFKETPKPESFDRKRLLGIGLAAFAALFLLLLLAKRRRRQ